MVAKVEGGRHDLSFTSTKLLVVCTKGTPAARWIGPTGHSLFVTSFIEAEWRSPLMFSRDQIAATDRAVLLARTRRGELVRLFPGIYAESKLWMSLDRDAQYRQRIEAVALATDRDFVVSHESAASLWRLPRIDAWPTRVHILERVGGSGRANSKLIRHPVGVPFTVHDWRASELPISPALRWMSRRPIRSSKGSPRSTPH